MNRKPELWLIAVLSSPFFAAAQARAQNPIQLTGTVAAVCNIIVTADPRASTLALTTVGTVRVQVGTIVQNCNSKAGYTLVVASGNCATTPVGAKLINSASAENVAYSAEFANPVTGGSNASVTGLLATACTLQTGRSVAAAKIVAETSTVFVNFTGSALLASGTYTDTLTIVMNVN